MAFQLSTEYEALKHDVKILFSQFYDKQSVRFEDFAAEWKALNFTSIFAANYRNTPSAKMRIVERAFRVASEFLSEESTFLYRVATVYMLYTVYLKQLCVPKVKIRMTPTMWKDLMDFLGIVVEHQHLDVAYIIQHLRDHHAFIYTALPKQIMFGRNEFMLGVEGMNTLRHTYEADKYINNFVKNSDTIDTLKHLQLEYNEVKQKVLDESEKGEQKCLSKMIFYSNLEFPDAFEDIMNTHKNLYMEGLSFKPDMSDTTQRPVLSQLQKLKEKKDTRNEGKDVSRATMISKIKQKSWKASVSHSSRKRMSVSEEQIKIPDDIDGNVFYKKSAMLQPFKHKSGKRSLATRGVRYKVSPDM